MANTPGYICGDNAPGDGGKVPGCNRDGDEAPRMVATPPVANSPKGKEVVVKALVKVVKFPKNKQERQRSSMRWSKPSPHVWINGNEKMH